MHGNNTLIFLQQFSNYFQFEGFEEIKIFMHIAYSQPFGWYTMGTLKQSICFHSLNHLTLETC